MGATNGAGIVWLTTNVCTTPWRASGTELELRRCRSDAVRVDRRRGVDRAAVDAARRRAGRSISSAPRANSALSGGTPIGTISPDGASWPRARSTSAYDGGPPDREHLGDARRAGYRVVGGDDDPGGPSAAGADDRDDARGVERTDPAEQRRGRGGVTDRGVDRG